MKKATTYLFLVFTFNSFSAENIFEKTDSLYQLHQYENAIEQYNLILETGLESPSVYYNLGICYYKLKEFKKSKNYFNRCLILDSENKKCEENIKLCDLKTLKKQPPKFIFVRWWETYLNLFPISSLYISSLITMLLLLLFTFMTIIKKKKVPKYIFAILILINILLYFTIQSKQLKHKRIFHKYSSII